MRLKFPLIALAAIALLAVPAAKADNIVGVDWTDDVSIFSNSELLSGSFEWDTTNGTLFDIVTQQSGDLFNISMLYEQPTAFVWNLYGAGEYTVEFLTEGSSLAPIGVLGDPGGSYYAQYLSVSLIEPTDPPASTDPPVSTPEPSSVLLSAMGMVALMGLSFLNDRDKTS